MFLLTPTPCSKSVLMMIILVHLIDAVHQCDFKCDEHLELFVVAICDCCEVVDLHTCRMGDPF